MCPSYTVEVDIYGGMSYLGGDNVMTHGPASGSLSADALRSLRDAVLRARETRMPPEECACGCVSDPPYVELTTWEKQVPRTVSYDEGCERVPPAIRALELEIDRAVGIERWIGTPEARRACFEEKRDCDALVGIPEPSPEP